MQIYDYVTGEVVEITAAQHDYIEAVIKNSGREDGIQKDYPVSREQIAEWKADPVFWPILMGYLKILVKSKGLSPEYVKEFLIDAMRGEKELSDKQLKAINMSIRALGLGTVNRSASLTVNPNTTTFTFNDGLDKPNA